MAHPVPPFVTDEELLKLLSSDEDIPRAMAKHNPAYTREVALWQLINDQDQHVRNTVLDSKHLTREDVLPYINPKVGVPTETWSQPNPDRAIRDAGYLYGSYTTDVAQTVSALSNPNLLEADLHPFYYRTMAPGLQKAIGRHPHVDPEYRWKLLTGQWDPSSRGSGQGELNVVAGETGSSEHLTPQEHENLAKLATADRTLFTQAIDSRDPEYKQKQATREGVGNWLKYNPKIPSHIIPTLLSTPHTLFAAARNPSLNDEQWLDLFNKTLRANTPEGVEALFGPRGPYGHPSATDLMTTLFDGSNWYQSKVSLDTKKKVIDTARDLERTFRKMVEEKQGNTRDFMLQVQGPYQRLRDTMPRLLAYVKDKSHAEAMEDYLFSSTHPGELRGLKASVITNNRHSPFSTYFDKNATIKPEWIDHFIEDAAANFSHPNLWKVLAHHMSSEQADRAIIKLASIARDRTDDEMSIHTDGTIKDILNFQKAPPSREVFAHLANSQLPSIRELAAAHPNIPLDLHVKLSQDPNEEVRNMAFTGMPRYTFPKLYTGNDPETGNDYQKSRKIPWEVGQQAFRPGVWKEKINGERNPAHVTTHARNNILNYGEIPDEWLNAASEHFSKIGDREYNKTWEQEGHPVFGLDYGDSFWTPLSHRSKMPIETFKRLLDHGDESWVEGMIDRNPRKFTPEEVDAALNHPKPLYRIQMMNRHDHPITPEQLTAQMEFPNTWVKAAALRHPNATAEMADRAIVDNDAKVQMSGMISPQFKPEKHIPMILGQDRIHPWVADFLTRYKMPYLSGEQMHTLLNKLPYKPTPEDNDEYSNIDDESSNLDTNDLKERIGHYYNWQAEQDGGNPEIYNDYSHPSWKEHNANAFWRLRNAIAEQDPDSVYEGVDTKYGTNWLRSLRDVIEESGQDAIPVKKLAPEYQNKAKTLGKEFRDKGGNISAKAIQAWIDAQPSTRWNISHREWDGGQQHSDEPSKVLQVNITNDKIKQLKAAGGDVYKAFTEAARYSNEGGHPNQKNGIGWIRYTGTPEEGFHIDEIQSDVESLTRDERAHGDENRKAAFKKMREIIFGGVKHPNEMLHDVFRQYWRNKGFPKAPVHIASLDLKRKNLHGEGDAPVHYKMTYEEIPKRWGMKPGTYGTLPTQSDEDTKGMRTHADIIRKTEEAWERWIELAKAEGVNDEVWNLINHPDPFEAALNIQTNPGVTADHLRDWYNKNVEGKDPYSVNHAGLAEVAKHPLLPTDVAAKIMKKGRRVFSAARQQVMLRPDLPSELVAEMFNPLSPEEAAANGWDPNDGREEWPLYLRGGHAYSIMEQPNLTQDQLFGISSHISVPTDIRRAAATKLDVPHLDSLITDLFTKIKNGTSHYSDNDVIGEVLGHANVPHDLQKKWYDESEGFAREAVSSGLARNKNISPEVGAEIFKVGGDPALTLWSNMRYRLDSGDPVDPKLIDGAVNSSSYHVRMRLAQTSAVNLSTEQIGKLLDDSNAAVRTEAARYQNINEDQARQLKDKLGYRGLALLVGRRRGDQLSPQFLSELADLPGVADPRKWDNDMTTSPEYSLALNLVSNPGLPSDRLEKIFNASLEDPRRNDRYNGSDLERNAMKNPNITDWMVNRAITEGGALYRNLRYNPGLKEHHLQKFIESPNFDSDWIGDIVRDTNSYDRTAASKQPWNESHIMWLAKHPNMHVRRELAQQLGDENVRFNFPEVERTLAHDPDEYVRKFMAHGVKDPELQQAFFNDPLTHDALYMNKNLNPALVEPLIRANPNGFGDYEDLKLSPDTINWLSEHPDKNVRQKIAKYPHLPSDVVTRMLQKENGPTSDGYVIENLIHNPSFGPEHVPVAQTNMHAQPGGYGQAALDSVLPWLDSPDEDSVEHKVGTGKYRKIRDLILEQVAAGNKGKRGKNRMPNEVKPKALPPGDYSLARMPNGNISADKIQQYIDAQPSHKWNVSWGEWTGIQKHSDKPSKVFQLNITNDQIKQLRDAGVWPTFKAVQEYLMDRHPVKHHTIGWVRFTGDPRKGIFVDEVQSDWLATMASKYAGYEKKQIRDERKGGSKISPEDEERRVKNAWESTNKKFSDADQKKIQAILFPKVGTDKNAKNVHPHEMLLEAFMQHLRDKKHYNGKISMRSAAMVDKHRELSSMDEGDELPAHIKYTYDELPKKRMGMDVGSYGSNDIPTEESNKLKGTPTYVGKVRKFEKLHAMLADAVALYKGERPAMAISDIQEGVQIGYDVDDNGPIWDYSHLLSKAQQDSGYRLRVVDTQVNGRPGVNAYVTLQYPGLEKSEVEPNTIGTFQSDLSDGDLYVLFAEISDEKRDDGTFLHKGQKLGQAMYEAAFAHAKAHHNVRYVAGDVHSSEAGHVHEALAKKHGMSYKAQVNWPDLATYTFWRQGAYDQKYKSYRYEIL